MAQALAEVLQCGIKAEEVQRLATSAATVKIVILYSG